MFGVSKENRAECHAERTETRYPVGIFREDWYIYKGFAGGLHGFVKIQWFELVAALPSQGILEVESKPH